MNLTEQNNNAEPFEQRWRMGLSCAWVALMFLFAANAYSQGSYFRFLLCLCFAGPGCKWMKPLAAFAGHWHFEQAKAASARRGQIEMNARLKDMTDRNQQDRQQATQTRWRREAITCLGSIDGYLRALENETDPSRRVVTLQSAYTKFMALKAEWAAGEVPPQVLSDRAILEHAKATSNHLKRMGLEGDRLHVEIVQLFNLPS